MTDTEKIWQTKSDEQLTRASNELADYTHEAERVIRAELKRRGLPEPPPAHRPVEMKRSAEPAAGLDIELPEGGVLHFADAQSMREPILRGDISRAAVVRSPASAAATASAAGKPVTPAKVRNVEEWAKSNETLCPPYAPIWAATLKGALWGFVVVAILKALDTSVLLFRANPAVWLLWLWVGALLVSQRWTKQILFVGVFVLFAAKNAINFGALFHVISSLFWGWFGVAVFAAAFGISAGMPIGTVVGAVRARRTQCAPDRQLEGTKPLIWGFAVPVVCFAGAAFVYQRFIVPYLVKELSQP